MKVKKCVKESFVVIGKEGSTLDGDGFIQKLWEDANGAFCEIQHLAKKDEQGNIAGIWGAMSDFTYSFKPWEENYTKGVYLAGVECDDDAAAPEGWTKWNIPGYEYLYVECDGYDIFSEMMTDIWLKMSFHWQGQYMILLVLKPVKIICSFLLAEFSNCSLLR